MQIRKLLRWEVLLLFSLLSCQSVNPYYHRKEKDWSRNRPNLNLEKEHTIFLIGDAGKAKESDPVLRLLKKEFQEAGEHSSVVFLGDNIYPKGLPEVGMPGRERAEGILDAQINTVKDAAGKAYFIPGNHDWAYPDKIGGRKAILRQEAYIEEKLANKQAFLPDNACGDPVAVEVEKDLAIIFIDSHWFLHDWEKEPEMNEGCEVKTRFEFREKLIELIDEYDGGHILLALHHPIFTNGPHGGYFSLQDHLFPLSKINKHLFLPLPIIGSIYPSLRYLGVSPQDLGHPLNQQLIQILQDVTYKKGNILFASGHEHALQYFRDASTVSDRHYIVSGAGSKEHGLRRGGRARFTYGKEGFAKLTYYKDGSVWLEMIRPLGNGDRSEVLFRKKVKDKSLSISPETRQTPLPKEEVLAFADTTYQAGKGKEFWFGKVYRDLWGTKLRFPVMDLSQLNGGLKPVKLGGGMQTRSLRFKAPDKRQYVIRSVRKDVTRAIQFNFPGIPQNTIISEIVQDQISMSNPYAAWVVPPLADAVGVPHSDPAYFFVPKQPLLGDFNERIGGEIYLFEERPTKHTPPGTSFGDGKRITSTPKVLRAIKSSNQHRINQKEVLRARLFDMLLGDWDRHDDQWRWLVKKEGKITWYQPIPRDRDQVFSLVNGVLPTILSSKWGLRFVHNFTYKTRDVVGLNFNAQFFDRTFLTEPSKSDWLEMAEEIKGKLSNEVIKNSIKAWPKEVYDLHGDSITKILIYRKDHLHELAEAYYKKLSKEVDVAGTDKRELFEVERKEPGITRVQLFRLNKEGEKKDRIYDRHFSFPETKEIRLYGLSGEDVFDISGISPKGSLIRVIGGGDADSIVDNSRVKGGRRTRIYDTYSGNKLQLGSEAKSLLSNRIGINTYNRKAFQQDKHLPLVVLGFNQDDGFIIGGGLKWTQYGFRKTPFKSQQTVLLKGSLTTGSLNGYYTGIFSQVLGKSDLYLDFRAFAPSYIINYFGLGNETPYSDEMNEDFDFNRLRFSRIRAFPAIQRSFNGNKQFLRFGPEFTFTQVERTPNRFVDSDPSLSEEDFKGKYYGGLTFNYELDGRDNPILPLRGLHLNFLSKYQLNLQDRSQDFYSMNADLAAYYTFYSPILISLATRIGFGRNWGNYEFFQAQKLGRRDNLRGYRAERFAGDAMFYHNTEIRIPLIKINNRFIPFRTGFLAYMDQGRVWYAPENSSKWHRGYGAGIMLSPLSVAVLTATYNWSEEFNIFEIKFGFFF